MEQHRDILADYREWAASQEQRVGTHSARCHLWHRDCMIGRLAAEVERLRKELRSELGNVAGTR